MRTKTYISLPDDLLQLMDRFAARYKNRSDFVETALRVFIAQLIRNEQHARDLEIINQRAEQLNKEAMDVLAYQVAL